MRQQQVRIWSAVLAASMLSMVGCGSNTPAHAADLITPDQARAAAMVHLQKTTTSAVVKDDAGSLRAFENASLVARPLPSPEPTVDPSITHNVSIWVAHQNSYPLSFLCFDAPTVSQGQALPEMFYFTKSSKDAPWTVTYQFLMGQVATAPDVAVDSNGYAQTIPAARYGALLAAPTQLANDYAAYVAAGNSSDTKVFAPGPMTSAFVDADNKTIRSAAQQKSDTVTFTAVPTGDPVVAYLLNDGGALVLFAVRVTGHVVAGKNPITVSQDGKGVTGPAPGKYRDTTTESLVFDAFIDPPKGSADKVTGIANYGGVVRTTGNPA